jgi:hypothetical protein
VTEFCVSSVEVLGSMTKQLVSLFVSVFTSYELSQTVPMGIKPEISKLNRLLMMRVNIALLSNTNFIT